MILFRSRDFLLYILSRECYLILGGYISEVIGNRQSTLLMAKIFLPYCPGWKNAVIVAMQCVKGDKMAKDAGAGFPIFLLKINITQKEYKQTGAPEALNKRWRASSWGD